MMMSSLGSIVGMVITYYYVKTGYWLARSLLSNWKKGPTRWDKGETSELKESEWKKLFWTMNIPNKTKIFLWRACHNFFQLCMSYGADI